MTFLPSVKPPVVPAQGGVNSTVPAIASVYLPRQTKEVEKGLTRAQTLPATGAQH